MWRMSVTFPVRCFPPTPPPQQTLSPPLPHPPMCWIPRRDRENKGYRADYGNRYAGRDNTAYRDGSGSNSREQSSRGEVGGRESSWDNGRINSNSSVYQSGDGNYRENAGSGTGGTGGARRGPAPLKGLNDDLGACGKGEQAVSLCCLSPGVMWCTSLCSPHLCAISCACRVGKAQPKTMLV